MATWLPRRLGRRAALSLIAAFSAIILLAAAVIVVVLIRAADPGRLTPGPPIAVGANPTDVEAGEGYVWVPGADDASLTRIDPGTGLVDKIDVGGEPAQIVVGDGAVWIRNYADRVTRVDAATLAVSPPIFSGGGQMGGMALGGGYLWLSHEDEATVTRLDTRSLAVFGTPTPVGGGPGPIETDNGSMFVLNTADSTMSRLDIITAAVTQTVLLGGGLGGVEVDRGVIYVASDGGIITVDEATYQSGKRYDLRDWTYFEVNDGTMWIVYDVDPGIQRIDAATELSVGERLPGLGDAVGRARFAYGKLWLTLPASSSVVAVGSNA